MCVRAKEEPLIGVAELSDTQTSLQTKLNVKETYLFSVVPCAMSLAPCYLSPVPPGFADVRAAGDGGAGNSAAGRLRHHLRALPRLRRSPPRRPRNIHITQVRISHFPRTAEE